MASPIAIVGVISDTHGLVRPEAVAALAGVDLIVHAGDVGSPDVLDRLGQVAPVHAVRGNVDRGEWADRLPESDVVEIGGHCLYVIHNLADLDLDPAAAEMSAVIAGHSHRPHSEQRRGVWYLNPGSAGPRRFKLPVALARLRIERDRIEPEIVDLSS